MAEVIESRKSEVLNHLQCVICLGDVKETRLCPHCSRLFCDKCIYSWLTNKATSCPACRANVQYAALVKGYSINEIQESIKQLFSSLEDKHVICNEHENQHFALFCYLCEINICVKCWFSEEHAHHKEQVVILEKAFEHYKQNMIPALTRINNRKEAVDKILNDLNEEKKQLENLSKKSEELFVGEVNPGTVMQIFETDREIANLMQDNHRLRQERYKWAFFWVMWIVAFGFTLLLILLYNHLDSDALRHQDTLQPGWTEWPGWCLVVSFVEWLYDHSDSWLNG